MTLDEAKGLNEGDLVACWDTEPGIGPMIYTFKKLDEEGDLICYNPLGMLTDVCLLRELMSIYIQ